MAAQSTTSGRQRMKLMYDPDEVIVRCNRCNKQRTTEPDYNPVNVIMDHTVGWFSNIDYSEEFCPDCMVKMVNEGGQRSTGRQRTHE